jgi:hypothetical protein
MNVCSIANRFVLMIALFIGSQLVAVEVLRVYQRKCTIVTGVLLATDLAKITMLEVSGRVRSVDKHEILGVARYSIKDFRPEPPQDPLPPAIKLTTKSEFESLRQITGWINGYTKEHIQIFGVDHQEYQILRSSIWDIEVAEGMIERDHLRSDLPQMADPLEFSDCGQRSGLHPFQSYTREVQLAEYFNQILIGQEEIVDYEDERLFYAVPQIFGNQTRLGSWAILASRYSDAGSRRVNFLPFVEDSLSEGPFAYQRRIYSGLAPVEWIDHTEPILSALYELKVSYVHFRFFLDPAIILLGDRYEWTKSQLDTLDERPAPIGGARFGIDIGHWSLFAMHYQGYFGVRFEDYFANLPYATSQFGLMYQNHRWLLELMTGGTSFSDKQPLGQTGQSVDIDADYSVSRFNIAYAWSQRLQLRASAVGRLLDLTSEELPLRWNYESTATDFALQVDWDYDQRWRLHARFMSEFIARKSDSDVQPENQKDFSYAKLASGITLAF